MQLDKNKWIEIEKFICQAKNEKVFSTAMLNY